MSEQLLQFIVIAAVLLVTMFVGVPVGFSLAITSIVAIIAFMSPTQLSQFGAIVLRRGTSMDMIVAPLFILMAEFLTSGDIATDLYDVINKYMQKYKAGLPIATIISCTVFAALCGSSPATAASIGRISIQEMTRHGYKPSLAAGTVAGAGTLGIMIPPSITFVSYGIITENSISKLLIAGVLPGIMLSLIMCIYVAVRVRLDPSLASADTPEFRQTMEAAEHEMAVKRLSRAQSIRKDVALVSPAMLLIIVVLGSLYLGWSTPVESAGIGAVGAMLIVLFRRKLNKDTFLTVMRNTAKTSNMILFVTICGLTLSYVVSYLGMAQALADKVVSMNVNKYVILLLLYLIWFVMGCLMDPGSMIVLTIPFIYPTMMEMGFDPLWLGCVSVLCVQIGMITPPVGFNLFIIKGVSGYPMGTIIKGILPYVFILAFGLVLLTAFPQIATFLPSRM